MFCVKISSVQKKISNLPPKILELTTLLIAKQNLSITLSLFLVILPSKELKLAESIESFLSSKGSNV